MPPNQPIHLAAYRGDLAEVQRLITEDPSVVELGGEGGRSPFLIAAWEGHAAMVEWLIDHAGAIVEAQDLGGFNMLYLSSLKGHPEVVNILVNRGANINKTDADDWSPLIVAALNGHVGVIDILVSQEGINLDAQNRYGRTALWMASSEGQEKVVRVLLASGADPRIARNGSTPLSIARPRRHHGCIQLLEAALVEPERARLLHRARAINDANHAANKVASETEGRTRGEKRRKLVAAAPAYMKGEWEKEESYHK